MTLCGRWQAAIFVDDADQVTLVRVEQALERFDAQILALCLVGDQHHFVLNARCATSPLQMQHFH